MPGHKGNAPFGPADLYALDTTELPGTDDLYTPQNGLQLAQEAWARAAGAACTLLLHNGSTVGLHVMLQLYAREGDTVYVIEAPLDQQAMYELGALAHRAL